MSFDLRSWLRRAPKPKSLRIKTRDGEERIIELGDKRFRWNACEETVRAAGAASIECLDAEGTVLRATRLSDEELEADNSEDSRDKHVSKVMAAQAQMLDRYGDRMVGAFEAGAKAASASSEQLIVLVSELTNHLGIAITNLHNVSVNLANIVTAAADGSGGSENGKLLAQVLALAAGGGAASKPNGKARTP